MCDRIMYKYRAITDDDRLASGKSFTRNLIANGELYFPKFSELSDPNEALFFYSHKVITVVDKEDLYQFPKHKLIDEMAGGGVKIEADGWDFAMYERQYINLRGGLLCLTSNSTSALMYDYYADGHKGICIGFDWSKFEMDIRPTDHHQQPIKIKYLDKPHKITPHNIDRVDDILFTKWIEYKHECEYRFTFDHGVFPKKQNVLKAIKEIIFGCCTSDSDKDLVRKWVDEAGISVDYFEAYLKPKSYNLILRKI